MKQLDFETSYPVTKKSQILDQIENATTSELLQMFKKIYHNQTDEEKQFGKTIYKNRKGFTKYDTKKSIYYARLIEGGRWLKLRHFEKIRKMLPKYWRQI